MDFTLAVRPTFKSNLLQFNKTIERAIKESSRAATRVINGHAFGVATQAIKLTEKASAERISQILAAPSAYTSKKGKVNKNFRLGKKAELDSNTFAARIVNARIRDTVGNDFQLHGNALSAAAKKLINARRAATSFIRSGWLWAIKDLAPLVSKKGYVPQKEAKLSPNAARKGKAIPARANFGGGMFKATIENTSLIASGGKFQAKGSHNPLPIAEKGLSLALVAENRNMEQHLMKKEMTAAMKKAGAM